MVSLKRGKRRQIGSLLELTLVVSQELFQGVNCLIGGKALKTHIISVTAWMLMRVIHYTDLLTPTAELSIVFRSLPIMNESRLGLFPIEEEQLLDNSSTTRIQEGYLFPWEIYGYALAVPLICLVGIGANTLSLFVYVVGDLKETIYIYLTGESRGLIHLKGYYSLVSALSVADLVTVVFVMFSGIARGIGKDSFFWAFVDAFLHIPIGINSSIIDLKGLIYKTFFQLRFQRLYPFFL